MVKLHFKSFDWSLTPYSSIYTPLKIFHHSMHNSIQKRKSGKRFPIFRYYPFCLSDNRFLYFLFQVQVWQCSLNTNVILIFFSRRRNDEPRKRWWNRKCIWWQTNFHLPSFGIWWGIPKISTLWWWNRRCRSPTSSLSENVR